VNEYVKIAEAARIVGVSQNTLRLWAESGKVPVRQNPANGYRLFRKKDLESFLGRLEAATSSAMKPKR
jgi:DNA-binding transcriptional MerR regulator